jgi:hypothetical protein
LDNIPTSNTALTRPYGSPSVLLRQLKHNRRERSLFSRRKHEKSQLAVQRTAKTSLGMRTGAIEMKIVVRKKTI